MKFLGKRFVIRFMLIAVALFAALLSILRPALIQRDIFRKVEQIGGQRRSRIEPITRHRSGWRWKYWTFVYKHLGREYASCYKRLAINNPDATDDDLRFLLQIPTLQKLDLSHTRVSDKLARKFSRLKKLKVVIFDNTEVTDATIDALEDLPLNCLSFVFTDVSAKRRDRYLSEHDKVDFEWYPRSLPSESEAIRNLVKQGCKVLLPRQPNSWRDHQAARVIWSQKERGQQLFDPQPLNQLPDFGLDLNHTTLTAEQSRELQKADNLVRLRMTG